MTVSATSTARFSLSLDQLWLIQHRCDAVVLPPDFLSEWGDVDDDERSARELAAELGLIDQGLVARGEAAFAARVDPAVLGFLAIFGDPALTVDVRSWGRGRTFVQSIAVLSGFAVGLVRTQRLEERGGTPQNEDVAELSAFEIPQLTTELLRSVTVISGDDGDPCSSGPATMSMVETQGLVQAIRTGNDAIIESAARALGHLDDVWSVRRAAADIVAGFTISARSRVSDDGLSAHWLCSADGWFELAVGGPSTTPPGTPDAVGYAESATVRIDPASRSSIVATVTTAVANLTGALHG